VTARRDFSDEQKDFIVADIHNRFTRSFRGAHIEAACLYWAGATRDYLNAIYDVGAVVQAGSMNWPFNATDDGVSPTHFSYEWDLNSPASREALRRGMLPEMHCWVAIPTTGQLVDLTTRYLVQRARQAGLTWTASEPPKFLWTHACSLPPRVLYRADRYATSLAEMLLALST
jgi:hypothetical protein